MALKPSIPIPYFLQYEKQKELNEHLIAKTGCFALLKTDQVLLSTQPASWQDAYSIFSIGLYVVYHDLGCRFLQMLITDNRFCLDTLPSPKKFKDHTSLIQNIIRPSIAHGMLHPSQHVMVQKRLVREYSVYSPVEAGAPCWHDFINGLNESQWESITTKMARDANQLYDYLMKWAEEWEKRPDVQDMKKHFGQHAFFMKSFDRRVCKQVIDANRPSYTITLPDEVLSKWQQTLSSCFVSGMASHPEQLYRKLEQLVREYLYPPKESSAEIASQYGFGIQ